MIDYLNIKNTNFDKYKLIIFYGNSGSGKSTYLKYFFQNKYSSDSIYFFHKDIKIEYIDIKNTNIFIDEIYDFRGYIVILKYLFSKKRVFVASHLHPYFFLIFRIFCKSKYFYINKNITKIKNYLDLQNYRYKDEDIKIFYKKYKGNFTDLQIILETKPNIKDFSIILNNFFQNYKIKYQFNYEDILKIKK